MEKADSGLPQYLEVRPTRRQRSSRSGAGRKPGRCGVPEAIGRGWGGGGGSSKGALSDQMMRNRRRRQRLGLGPEGL